jgi:DNA excision repair protein ERCC-2
MLFRHPKVRKYQDKFMQDILESLREGRVLLAEAPTGLGKTDAVLGATLSYLLKEGGWIFFLTPKISQHEIAIDVVEGINKKYGLDISVVDFVGKRYMCIHPALQDIDSESFYLAC